VAFPSRELEEVLGKTLGVPLFQEQAMKIAIVAAGFTPGEADGLRRAMATFRKTGTIHTFQEKMIDGMVARGYEADFAERCFHQIEGFGNYGFPESHAASFALLVYVSAWLKCYYPDIFAAALLNSQPMGFYAPAQIVRDARDHDVEVRGPDINHSDWDHTLEPVEEKGTLSHRERVANESEPGEGLQTSQRFPARPYPFTPTPLPKGEGLVPRPGYALRLGLRQVKGLKEEAGQAIAAAREEGYGSVGELWRRARVTTAALKVLAAADAFGSLGLDRREAMWAIRALGHNGGETAQGLPLFAAADTRHRAPVADNEPKVTLPVESDGEAVANDYTTLRLSLKNHPVGVTRNETLVECPNGASVTVAGLVLVRQRPGSANGVIFVTLEDDTGVANVIVWPDAFARFRKIVLSARLLRIDGTLQREGIVTHVIAKRIIDMSDHLDALGTGEAADSPQAPTPKRLAPANPRRHPRDNHIRIASRDFH
jgi:error-prone DNA polymerase